MDECCFHLSKHETHQNSLETYLVSLPDSLRFAVTGSHMEDSPSSAVSHGRPRGPVREVDHGQRLGQTVPGHV